MKNFIKPLLIVILTFIISGCGGGSDSSNITTPQTILD